jgi:choline dehydrogenase-like flavoprotein
MGTPMFTTGREVSRRPGSRLGVDVCVIGAGPAGLTVARKLAGAGAEVAILESGGVGYTKSLREPWRVARQHLRGAQGLSSGKTLGQPYTLLRFSRARAFGGSTNALLGHGLQTRPLDPVDFEERAGVAHSGWPIGYPEVAAYLEEAQAACGLAPDSYEAAPWQVRTGLGGFDLEGTALESTVFRNAPGGHFASQAAEFGTHERVRVVTDATVVRLETSRDGDEVRAAHARTLGGERFAVEAPLFVLATGALENARLLLVSNDRDPRGLGNEHDVVGRYFMEHPQVTLGFWEPTAEALDRLDFYETRHVDGEAITGQLRIRDEELRRRGLLNGAFELHPMARTAASAGWQAVNLVRRSLQHRNRVHGAVGAIGTALRHAPEIAGHVRSRRRGGGDRVILVEVMAEQQPNHESRVRLGRRIDRVGMPETVLDWRLSATDFASMRGAAAVLDEALRSRELGRFESALEVADERVPVFGNWHQMGTTRMHADPREGVVDGDCRVHGVGNLYVGGSSVFTTGGCSNPTLTIVALAARLADALSGALRAS